MPLPILPSAEGLLLDLLSPISLGNLSLTSKELRQQIRQHIDRLQLYTSQDISLLLKHKWPRLAHLSFVAADLGKDNIAVRAEAKDLCLPAITHLGICQKVFAAEAMHELANGRWSGLAALTLSESLKQAKPSPGFSFICKSYASAAWPQLSTLDLSGCVLTSHNFHQLTTAQYAPLQHLILRGIQLAAGSFVHLQEWNLQQLTKLDLSHCFGLSRGTGLLFRLKQSITACKFIAACSWPDLVVLNLSSNSFGASEMAELAKANWPALGSLDLSANGGLFIKELVSAGWTSLQELNLSHLQLADSDVQQLGSAHLSQLTALNLQRVSSVSRYVSRVVAWDSAQVQWPLLVKLHASKFLFKDVLTQWSSVTWLDVSCFALKPEQVMTLLDARGHSLDTLKVACEVSSPVRVAPKLCSWPRDTFLQLKVLLRASILQSLSLGHWPAKQVAMVPDLFPQEAKLVHQLTDVLKLDLGVVRLHLRNIIPASLKHLAYGPWLALQRLDLSFICLKPVEVEHLVNARISLRELDLSCANLSLKGVKQLRLGQWPLLEKLAMHGNHLHTAKLKQFVEGRWPSLQSVDLHSNKVRSGDVEILLRAQWPSLAYMCLTGNIFNSIDTEDYVTGKGFDQLCNEAEKDFKIKLQAKWSKIRVVF